MNVLITGGAGYIGTALINELEKEKSVQQIIVYDNLSRGNYNFFLGESKLKNTKIRYVKGDILDSHKLSKEVEKVDVVFHLAAKVSTPFADHNPHEFDQVNNWGTAGLVQMVEKSNVRKFIYISSISVYGASEQMLALNTALNPRTFYGISKMHAEEHVKRLYNTGISTYILRPGNAYGYSKSMRFDSVINKFMFDANFSNRLRIYGDGNQQRSFVHIDRLVSVILEVAMQDQLPSNTYNLVEDTFSINDIVEELKLLYPALEMVFVNQNMKMRSLKVKMDERITSLNASEGERLRIDLQSFKEHFSF